MKDINGVTKSFDKRIINTNRNEIERKLPSALDHEIIGSG